MLLHLDLRKKKMISIQLDYCSAYILKIVVMTSGKYRCQNVTWISANDTQSSLVCTDWPGTQIFWSILFSPCQSCSFPCSPPPNHWLRMTNEQPHAYSQRVFSSVWNQRVKLRHYQLHISIMLQTSDHRFILLQSLFEGHQVSMGKEGILPVSVVSFFPWNIRTWTHACQNYWIHILKGLINSIYSEVSKRTWIWFIFTCWHISLTDCFEIDSCLCRIG